MLTARPLLTEQPLGTLLTTGSRGTGLAPLTRQTLRALLPLLAEATGGTHQALLAVRVGDTPKGLNQVLRTRRVLDQHMAHYKGPRRGFNLKWLEEDRRLAQVRAEKAGLTMTDYLVTLLRRDEVDSDGRPVWAPEAQRVNQLPMELSA